MVKMVNSITKMHALSNRENTAFMSRRMIDFILWVLFAVTFVWYWSGSFIAYRFIQDESYMALCCRDYAEQPIAMLSFYIGWLGTQLFGDHVIVLRLLAAASMFGAALIPCVYFYRQTGNKRWTVFLLTVCMIAIRCTRHEFFSWDTMPTIFAGWLLTILVSYVRTPSNGTALWGAVALAMLVLSRVPTAIVAVPVCIVVIFAVGNRWGVSMKMRLRLLGKCAVLCILVSLVIMVLMCGSPTAYFGSWIPENIINGHNLRDMVKADTHWNFSSWAFRYMCGTYWLFHWGFLALLVTYLVKGLRRLYVGIILLTLIIVYNVMTNPWVSFPFFAIAGSLLLYVPCHNLVERYVRHGDDIEKMEPLVVWVVLFFSLVQMVGSDQLPIRITFFYSIPLLMVFLYSRRKGILLWIMLFMTLPALAAGIRNNIDAFGQNDRLIGKLPRRELIADTKVNIDAFLTFKSLTDSLTRMDEKYLFIGPDRYELIYFYQKDKPFHLNHFHYYYRDESLKLIHSIPDSVSVVIIKEIGIISLTPEELEPELAAMGFRKESKVGEYEVYGRRIKRKNEYDGRTRY